MKSYKEEFPNPVLASGRDDYVENCRFYTSFEESNIEVGNDFITIPVKYTLECEGLAKRLENGDVTVVVIVKCSASSFSQLFPFKCDENEKTIEVPKYSVVSKIEITGHVIAAHDIHSFSCPGEFNDMYFGGSTFEIRKGDILATEESRTIFIDNSELEKPISSIFDISRRDEQESDIIPSFEDHKITVYLKGELYDLYYKFKDFNNGSLRRYAAGVIVYPVLVEAISYVIGYYQNQVVDEEYSEYRWFRAIVYKSEQKGIDLTSYEEPLTTLADKLLGNVSIDALKSFKDTLDSEVNSGESQMIGGID